MRQIVYHSVAAKDFDESEVFKIIVDASTRNSSLEVSGFLIYSDHRFLQLLEGSTSAVHDLVSSISRDTRHTDFTMIYDEIVDHPSFPSWKMRRVPADNAAAARAFLESHQNAGLKPEVMACVEAFMGAEDLAKAG